MSACHSEWAIKPFQGTINLQCSTLIIYGLQWDVQGGSASWKSFTNNNYSKGTSTQIRNHNITERYARVVKHTISIFYYLFSMILTVEFLHINPTFGNSINTSELLKFKKNHYNQICASVTTLILETLVL